MGSQNLDRILAEKYGGVVCDHQNLGRRVGVLGLMEIFRKVRGN